MTNFALSLPFLLISTVQGHLRLSENGETLFKNIRSLMDVQASRRLPPTTDYTTIRCFYECIEQKMTASQCEDFIKSVIGQDLSLHEIPDLKIKIRRPRTKEAISESYFMLGIPVNIYGEVDCELNDAVISYPWLWTAGGVDYAIPDTNCQNLNAEECCTAVMKKVDDAGIPLLDDKGNCLSCWVHQEPLEPIISDATGSLAYIEYDFEGGTCLQRELPRATVQTEDDSVEAKLAVHTITMQDYIENGATCDQLLELQKALMMDARSFPYAENLISNLLCGHCEDVTTYEPLPQELIDVLQIIVNEISGEINSDTNTIIIYTDRHENVIEPPKIGGSRAGLDIDLDDPDCPPETAGDSPVSSPVLPPVGVSVPVSSPIVESPSFGLPAPTVTSPLSSPVAQPPVEAPASPVAPPVGVTSPVSSPIASPVAPPVSSPIASPVAPPVSSPIASPVEPPVGVISPVSFPVASPAAPPVGATSPVSSPIAEAPSGIPPFGGSIPVSSPLSGTPPTGCPATMILVDGKCVCSTGKFVSRGGKHCSSDPGDACPEGSYLTKAGTCLDCNCGFCQSSSAKHASCCRINGAGNNCHSVGSREENCRFNANFFPGYSDQTGDVCSGVEVKKGAQIPVGCGCKPSSVAECTYDKSKNSCFVCSAEDLANTPSSGCDSCKTCLIKSCATKWSSDKKNYDFCKTISSSTLSSYQWQTCLASSASSSSNKNPDCALECSSSCMKM